jgi:hypothetical protein
VQDADRVGAEFLGMATIPAKAIVGGQPYDQWLDLVDKAGQPVGCWERKKFTQAKLHISITFKPVGAKVSRQQQQQPAAAAGVLASS